MVRVQAPFVLQGIEGGEAGVEIAEGDGHVGSTERWLHLEPAASRAASE
jgi:hypothetical protein